MTTYLIIRVKKDKRFKVGFDPKSYKILDETDNYYTAQRLKGEYKKSGYAVGIEERTEYIPLC